MKEKFNLPVSTKTRKSYPVDTGNGVSVEMPSRNSAITEEKELQKLKNIEGFLELGKGIIELQKITAQADAQVQIIEAHTRQIEAETENYIKKVKADTSQYVGIGQIARNLVAEMSEFLQRNPDLSAAERLEAIKFMHKTMDTIAKKHE